jgi:hypothetical protein
MGFLYQDTGAASGQTQQGIKSLEEARKQQGGLAQALQAQYAGTGPSAAQGMLQRGSEEAIKRSAGALASQRGINPALAQRLASQQAAEQTQRAAESGAILKGQESQAALSGLQNVYGTMGQQALGQYGTAQQALTAQEAANQRMTGQLVGGLMSGAGALAGKYLRLAEGGVVPGKAEVEGDSYANDKVPAMLSPGEVVIPRSKAEDPDKAKEFIDKIMTDEADEDAKEVTYADVLAMQKQLAEMIKKLGK